MWNQSKLWIQTNRIPSDQVLWGWGARWKWRRDKWRAPTAKPLCKFPRHCVWQATTLLCIYAKAWQDTVHTALLSKRSHARVVTPIGWPLTPMRLPAQKWHFIQTDARTQTTSKSSLCVAHTLHLRGQTWQDAKITLCSSETWHKRNNLISGAFIIPAEVKTTWLALWSYSAASLFDCH